LPITTLHFFHIFLTPIYFVYIPYYIYSALYTLHIFTYFSSYVFYLYFTLLVSLFYMFNIFHLIISHNLDIEPGQRFWVLFPILIILCPNECRVNSFGRGGDGSIGFILHLCLGRRGFPPFPQTTLFFLPGGGEG